MLRDRAPDAHPELLIKIIRRNICFKASFNLLKSIKTYLSQFIDQQILLVIFGRYGGEKQFVIIHFLFDVRDLSTDLACFSYRCSGFFVKRYNTNRLTVQ